MKISMIMVMSLDGVIAKDENHNAFLWTSKEDKIHFQETSKKIGTIIMGGNTFRASGREDYPGRYGVIVTNNPKKYKYKNKMTTKSGSPKKIISELEDEGIKEVAVIGGASLNRQFLIAGIVNELIFTVEPKMFGKGMHVFEEEEIELDLTLLSTKQLNENGTLVLHYRVNN